MTDRSKAIFLSYSADDEEPARRLSDGLRGTGLETWFDRNELRGGDAWDTLIRNRIHECALFVPIISARTEARSEGYFRLEWRLAVERSFQMADDQPFLLPVVVDATPQASARVPERFRERHWTYLPGGEPSPQFVAHVQRLLAPTPTAHQVPSEARPASTISPIRGPWRRIASGALALGVVAALGIYLWLRHSAVPVQENSSLTPPARTAAAAQDHKSIAVLPFENLTGRAEDAYLADGLQEEILNALARIRALKVISRSSAEEFRGARRNVREIGERLGVGTVLEGSVRRDHNTMRLTVQLIDTHNDRHLLATNYDRDLQHILGLQSEVAHEVADALAATLSQFERGELDHVGTNNGDAYRTYLKAVAMFRRPVATDQDVRAEAIRLLDETVRLDPEFADAHALLAQAHVWAYMNSALDADGAQAKVAFERALTIDPELTDARLARGLYELYVSKDRELALSDLEPVAQRRPNSPVAQGALAVILRRLGRMTEALPYFERAWSLDPLSDAYALTATTTFLGLRRWPEALGQLRLYVTRFPQDPIGYTTEAHIASFVAKSQDPLRALLRERGASLDFAVRMGITAELAAAEGRYRDAIKLWESMPGADAVVQLETLGFLYHAAGDSDSSAQRFHSLERELQSRLRAKELPAYDGLKVLAIAQSMLGEHAAAIKTIEQAREQDGGESVDPVNGPAISFVRSIVLARAGQTSEAYAEVDRLLHVPFGAPANFYGDPDPVLLLLKDDPHYDALIHHPPRL